MVRAARVVTTNCYPSQNKGSVNSIGGHHAREYLWGYARILAYLLLVHGIKSRSVTNLLLMVYMHLNLITYKVYSDSAQIRVSKGVFLHA